MFNLNTKNTKLESLRSFLLPVATFIILVGLSATVGRTIVNLLLEAKDSIGELTAKNETLTAKKQILSSLDKEELVRNVQSSTRAFPNEGPILPAFVAIRSTALSKGIQLNNVRFSGSKDNVTNLQAVNFSFDTRGTLQASIDFLREIKKIAPLMRVQKVKFAVNQDSVSGSIVVSSLWEPLPETFGKVDDAISTIEAAEKELLSKMADLKSVTTSAPSSGPVGGRKNPFSF